ncbi:alpha/beta fold hydrolase [Caenimonas soli]|uniref:alpha/beta fold hydrolase n=1 Tax=Caenimonas soli TaxID=2735555 RepID=UPI00155239E7|nr:alpha/beta hydrolase [Caenimonas soli]NPC54459.1 alpha/beta hydrolase [Caenimonas soli]
MTTWVLLRGLTREAGHWGDFAHRLAGRLDPKDKVVALDLPGNGTRNASNSPASVPAMAAACRQDLADRGMQAPFAFVGMSLGGMVALHGAYAYADEVSGCVLINSSLRGHGAFWQRLRPLNYARLCRFLLPFLSPYEREHQVLLMTSADPQRHPEVARQWETMATQRPVSRSNALRQLAAAARYAPPAGPPAVPLLLLASAGDRLVSPQCSARLAAQWEVPLRMHPSAGHDLPLDDPEWVVQQIVGWRRPHAVPPG